MSFSCSNDMDTVYLFVWTSDQVKMFVEPIFRYSDAEPRLICHSHSLNQVRSWWDPLREPLAAFDAREGLLRWILTWHQVTPLAISLHDFQGFAGPGSWNKVIAWPEKDVRWYAIVMF